MRPPWADSIRILSGTTYVVHRVHRRLLPPLD